MNAMILKRIIIYFFGYSCLLTAIGCVSSRNNAGAKEIENLPKTELIRELEILAQDNADSDFERGTSRFYIKIDLNDAIHFDNLRREMKNIGLDIEYIDQTNDLRAFYGQEYNARITFKYFVSKRINLGEIIKNNPQVRARRTTPADLTQLNNDNNETTKKEGTRMVPRPPNPDP